MEFIDDKYDFEADNRVNIDFKMTVSKIEDHVNNRIVTWKETK